MEKKQRKSDFLAEFPPADYQHWLDLVEQQLKGVPFEKNLITQSPEGIPIQPIYIDDPSKSDQLDLPYPGQYPFVRGNTAGGFLTGGWRILQHLSFPAPEMAGKTVSGDRHSGISGFSIQLDEPTRFRKDPDTQHEKTVLSAGLSLFCEDDFNVLLKHFNPDDLYIQIDTGLSSLPLMSLLLAYLEKNKIDRTRLSGDLVNDYMAILATNGTVELNLQQHFDELALLTKFASNAIPDLKPLGIDGRPYREAGGSIVQELACTLASGAETARQMIGRGLTVDEVGNSLTLHLTIGPDFFMEIAKFRAIRILWSNLMKAFGAGETAQKATVSAYTGQYNKTVYDPHVNLLRTTTEAFAAILGGCDSLTVLPYDHVLGLPDELSKRIARNIQIILKEECHGNRVIDPAGGSWYVESMTRQLSEKSWALFQKIEAAGGIPGALEKGFIQSEIESVDKGQKEALAARKKVSVGTNMYANLTETKPDKNAFSTDTDPSSRINQSRKYKNDRSIDPGSLKLSLPEVAEISAVNGLIETLIQKVRENITLEELGNAISGTDRSKLVVKPLQAGRISLEYEALRDLSEQYRQENGNRPRVLLVNMGPLRQHKARADFSTGFLEPGGFSVVWSRPLPDVATAVDTAVNDPAGIIVICSTDDTYPDIVPDFTKSIKAKHPDRYVIVAGYPEDWVRSFEEAGVDAFIHLKANNLELLKRLYQVLGIIDSRRI